MRAVLLFAWLLVPVAFGTYHYGPGQTQLIVDEAGAEVAAAEAALREGNPRAAATHFDAALAKIPHERVAEIRKIRVEKAKALLQSSQLPAAYDEMSLLLEEMAGDKTADPETVAAARQVMAGAQYYITWLMRLEGEPREAWEPEIEAARQNYRLLAEQALEAGDATAAEGHRKDLEAAIRLARMDLSDLQALALPSQCKGCCSGECQCKGKGKKPGKKPGKSQNKERQDEKARGASSGPPPDGSGS